MTDIRKLQNGSDVRGIACAGIAGEDVNLTEEAGNLIGGGFIRWLADKKGKKTNELRIGIGHDSRITADSLFAAAAKGILATGAKVYDCGLVSTPSMFMTTVFDQFAFDGAIMITASHLPFNRNGYKFFDRDGGLEHDDITKILETASELTVADAGLSGVEKVDSISVYCEFLREKIKKSIQAVDYDKPLAGLHIVVDTGNGAGGFFVDKVLNPLGADASGSQFLEPDGHFPNHIPNPENKQAMEAIRQAVLTNKADLGIIFDTDVDRMSAVLPNGDEVNRDAIIAMMTAIIAEDYPGGTIVTDSVTSDRLTRFIEGIGMKHHRYMRGYKNVINESIRLNQEGVTSPLAIETSGHGALSENYFLDDGAYMAVKLLIALAKAAKENKTLASFIENLEKGFEEREYRFRIQEEDFKEYGKNALHTFEERAKAKGYHIAPNSYEGIRITFDTDEVKGWLLLRMSLHDPQMPLNIEGVRDGDCDRLFDIVVELLDGFDKLVIPTK
ncbi:MAG: phosphomannomutase/phosphoglucomutase [Lachnospiraceae bacterium]|nr:phosphomannomutase/phosphoglucomutase [Lachnospiraceae bacterium]HBV83830.1 phosphomannomutase/phosphoglucomutase [Lachnospiraceae bacterium]